MYDMFSLNLCLSSVFYSVTIYLVKVGLSHFVLCIMSFCVYFIFDNDQIINSSQHREPTQVNKIFKSVAEFIDPDWGEDKVKSGLGLSAGRYVNPMRS